MTQLTLLLGTGILTFSPLLRGQALDHAEVRMPYAELKQLLANATPPAKPPAPKPALLAARLRLSLENGRPVLDATFRTANFASGTALIPLVGGDVVLANQVPGDAALVVEGPFLCLAVEGAGIRALEVRLLPVLRKDRFGLTLPACPSLIFETGELPADQSVVLGSGDSEETLAGGQVRPLPNTGPNLTLRLLDSRETREALRPPQPSTWTWQNQTLVMPADGGLIYQTIASATAADGSGVDALLPHAARRAGRDGRWRGLVIPKQNPRRKPRARASSWCGKPAAFSTARSC